MCNSPALRIAIICALVVLAFAPGAAAQDKGKVGLVVGYPASVGVLWQASERIGIRLDGSYSHSSSESEDNREPETQTIGNTVITLGGSRSRSESTTHGGTIGVSMLVDLKRSDRFAIYLAPRVSLTISRSTTHVSRETSRPIFPGINVGPPEISEVSSSTSSEQPAFSALFGARSEVNDHFTVFGEVGFGYSRFSPDLPTISVGSASASLPTSTTTVRTFGMRSGVGLTVFF